MYEDEEVEENEGKSFAKEIGAIFQLTSPRDGSGINELFLKIGKRFLNPNSTEGKHADKTNYKIKDNDKTNKDLLDKIKKLEKELNDEKNKNKRLEKEITDLKIKLDKEIKKYKDLNDKIEKEKKIRKKDTKESLYERILEKDKEVNELKKNLSKYPFELNDGEKLMTIIFQSSNEEINYGAICKNTDKFNIIENQLYEHYPEYGENENFFTFNGKKINKNKSMEENNIKNNDIIILNTFNK